MDGMVDLWLLDIPAFLERDIEFPLRHLGRAAQPIPVNTAIAASDAHTARLGPRALRHVRPLSNAR